ncbi:hypothetical protein [Nocardioides sp.]|uniref:hypothetical protein n=1 Tax=Nocardioides sp. TaxID=35761 RepID=UPI00356534A7
MSEHDVDQAQAEAPETPAPEVDVPETATPETATPETGVPAVDEVLASMAEVTQRPVHEHVEIFGRAQDQLRRALDDAGSE